MWITLIINHRIVEIFVDPKSCLNYLYILNIITTKNENRFGHPDIGMYSDPIGTFTTPSPNIGILRKYALFTQPREFDGSA